MHPLITHELVTARTRQLLREGALIRRAREARRPYRHAHRAQAER